MVDNFDLIGSKLLKFVGPGDFYVVHVIQRAKDLRASGDYGKGSAMESQRLVKTWYIDSFSYWEEKIPIIKSVADDNHARAYILPQVRNRLTINRVLLKKMVEVMDDVNLRYDHLIRTAVCGCHHSTRPYWVADLDTEMILEGDDKIGILRDVADKMVVQFKELVDETGRSPDEVFTVPTRNGLHILTPPFNITKWLLDNQDLRPLVFTPENSRKDFLKKDAMTLLYFNG